MYHEQYTLATITFDWAEHYTPEPDEELPAEFDVNAERAYYVAGLIMERNHKVVAFADHFR